MGMQLVNIQKQMDMLTIVKKIKLNLHLYNVENVRLELWAHLMDEKANDEEEKMIKEKLKQKSEIRKKNANLVMRWMNDILQC